LDEAGPIAIRVVIATGAILLNSADIVA